MSQLAIVGREVGGRVGCHDCFFLSRVERTWRGRDWGQAGVDPIGKWLYNDAQRVMLQLN